VLYTICMYNIICISHHFLVALLISNEPLVSDEHLTSSPAQLVTIVVGKLITNALTVISY